MIEWQEFDNRDALDTALARALAHALAEDVTEHGSASVALLACAP